MAKKRIVKKPGEPHCLRNECGWHDPGSTDCFTCGWWSTEFERRQRLPFEPDPKTGLRRKFVGRHVKTEVTE